MSEHKSDEEERGEMPSDSSGWLIIYKGINQISKYNEDNESLVSYCQRKKL